MELYKICDQKLQYFRYSEHTAKIYLHYIDEFLLKINKHHSRLNSRDVQEYLNKYNFTSGSQQNQVISALKFMWEKGLGKKYLKIDFKRPRKDKKLPKIIDKDFLLDKIDKIENLKHKAIISLGASTGMRVSEVINLKIEDIDSKRMIIHIKNSKGNKDRYVKLSIKMLELLRGYYKVYKPNVYLFNGANSLQYSSSSCNKIVKKYIDKKFHFHLLRHFTLTNLVDEGTDINTVKEFAGHSSINSTLVYLHLSNKKLQNLPLAL